MLVRPTTWPPYAQATNPRTMPASSGTGAITRSRRPSKRNMTSHLHVQEPGHLTRDRGGVGEQQPADRDEHQGQRPAQERNAGEREADPAPDPTERVAVGRG